MKKPGLFPGLDRQMMNDSISMPGAIPAFDKSMVIGIPGTVSLLTFVIWIEYVYKRAAYLRSEISFFLSVSPGEGGQYTYHKKK